MQTWTNASLAAAVTALPAGTTAEAAAAIFAAQIVQRTNQPFTVHDARIIAAQSTNFSWARIVMLSRMSVSGAIPPTQQDQAIIAAVSITELADAQVIDPSLPAAWAAWQAGQAALVSAGALTAADASAILALTTVTAPAWAPIPTAADITTVMGVQ